MKKEVIEDLALDDIVESIIQKANLSDKRAMFVREYAIDFNATQAAIRAGYSKKTAQPQSSRLLSNVIISKCIRDIKRERYKFLNVGKNDVLAFYGNALHDPQLTHAERERAADKLARINGLYKDKINVNLSGSLAERLSAARKRKA